MDRLQFYREEMSREVKGDKDLIPYYKRELLRTLSLNSTSKDNFFLELRCTILKKIGRKKLIQLEHDEWIGYWGSRHNRLPKNFRFRIIIENSISQKCIDAVINGLDWANKHYSLDLNIEMVDPNSKEYQTELQRFNSNLNGENIGYTSSVFPNGSYVFVSRRRFDDADWGNSSFHGGITLALTPDRQKYINAIRGVTIHEAITHFLDYYHHEAYSLEGNYGYKENDFCVTRYDCLEATEPCQRCDEAIKLLLR